MGDDFRNTDDAASPLQQDVRTCLARILSVEPFSDSPQLAAFLTFIVDETLAGKGRDLKGYSIATLALGRKADFDPQADPIVRVQAGRVRQALAEYYVKTPGESILIALPKGTYEPAFSLIEREQQPLSTAISAPTASVPAASNPRVSMRGLRAAMALAAVLILAGLSAWLLRSASDTASSIFEYYAPSLVVEGGANPSDHGDLAVIVQRTRDAVSRFDDIIIVHDGVQKVLAAASSIAPKAGQQFALRIGASGGGVGKMRIAARLVDQRDQTVVWSREYEPVFTGPGDDVARTRIVQSIATTVAQPYGVIHAYVRTKALRNPVKDDPYGCLIAGFDYWLANDSKTHLSARECLQERIKRFPTAGAFHAQLTYLYLEEFRLGYNPLPGDPLARALSSATRSVSLSPTSARSYQALMAAHFSRREMESAWRAGGEAMALNPYDTEILADMGARHVQSGHFEKGLGMLQQALELNTSPPTWAVTFRAMALYMLGRQSESAPLIRALQGSEYPPAMMALVVVAFNTTDAAAGKTALAQIKRVHPRIVADPAAFLQRLNFEEKTAARMIEEFRIARAWVEGQ